MTEVSPTNPAPAQPILVTFMGVAHPWMCDAMGHLNIRHYAAMFDDASFQLLSRIAAPTAPGTEVNLGWADVRMEIDFKHETPAGTPLTIVSAVEKIGNSSVTYLHTMSNSLTGQVHAQARIVTLRFDLQKRAKMSLDAQARARAQLLMM